MLQGVTRTHFLRQAAERNVRHYQNVERPMSLAFTGRA